MQHLTTMENIRRMDWANTQRYFWGKALSGFKYSINGMLKAKYCQGQFASATSVDEATMGIRFMSSNRLEILFLATFFAGACSAQVFSCPEQIKTPASLIDDYPGWKSFTSSQPQYFEQISLTAGSPDQDTTLVPDMDTSKQVGWTISAGEEYWMVCNYLSSNVRLAQRLPAGVKQCSVKRKLVGTKATQQANTLTCK